MSARACYSGPQAPTPRRGENARDNCRQEKAWDKSCAETACKKMCVPCEDHHLLTESAFLIPEFKSLHQMAVYVTVLYIDSQFKPNAIYCSFAGFCPVLRPRLTPPYISILPSQQRPHLLHEVFSDTLLTSPISRLSQHFPSVPPMGCLITFDWTVVPPPNWSHPAWILALCSAERTF